MAYDSEDNRNYCYNSFSFGEIGFFRMSGYTDRGSNSIYFNQAFQLKTLVIKMMNVDGPGSTTGFRSINPQLFKTFSRYLVGL